MPIAFSPCAALPRLFSTVVLSHKRLRYESYEILEGFAFPKMDLHLYASGKDGYIFMPTDTKRVNLYNDIHCRPLKPTGSPVHFFRGIIEGFQDALNVYLDFLVGNGVHFSDKPYSQFGAFFAFAFDILKIKRQTSRKIHSPILLCSLGWVSTSIRTMQIFKGA